MAADDARLVFEEDVEHGAVWLHWCRGSRAHRSERILRALRTAAQRGAQYCRDAVAKPFPPAAKKGEPPHRRSGKGQRSIEWGASRARLAAFVRTRMDGDFNHMAYHDQHGRPWLLATLQERHAELERMVRRELA